MSGKHAWAILALLLKRLREGRPKARIILRGDSGFSRHHMLTGFERIGGHYDRGNPEERCLAAVYSSAHAVGPETD